MDYFKLCCGQAEARMRTAHGRYMKYSVNLRRISSFIVGRPGSEYDSPVAVISGETKQLPSKKINCNFQVTDMALNKY